LNEVGRSEKESAIAGFNLRKYPIEIKLDAQMRRQEKLKKKKLS
jgi:hypothetical protein